jgi:hypothetical protein
MPIQAALLHRCASCNRWGGPRQIGTAPQTVEIASELTTGLCVGGPWNGSERRARSACGQWAVWPALTKTNASD